MLSTVSGRRDREEIRCGLYILKSVDFKCPVSVTNWTFIDQRLPGSGLFTGEVQRNDALTFWANGQQEKSQTPETKS